MTKPLLEPGRPLDMNRRFLPEAMAGLASVTALDDDGRRLLNPIRACSYVHLFDVLESAVGTVARERSRADVEVRDVLWPLLRFDTFDHHELFFAFESAFASAFPVRPQRIPFPDDLVLTLTHVTPLSLLVLALHLKLVTQQHYLACVRGHENLEPHFVRLLKEHWDMECGGPKTHGAVRDIQHALAEALPGRVPSALRDYRLLVFACDDVLRRQTELDVTTLEEARGRALAPENRARLLGSLVAAHREAFLSDGIVNAAFVYAMRSLGPTAPSMLAGIVAALATR